MTTRPVIDTLGLRQRAQAQFLREPQKTPGRGDNDLNPGSVIDDAAATAAAVLVPVIMRRSGLTVLFTQRTANLAAHPGQVAFPGGKIDPQDDGPLAAALREAEEEIGLSRRFVEPIGFLDTYLSGSGFSIVPAVALVTEGFALQLNAREVAEVFEVPLAFFLDDGNHVLQSRHWRGRERHFYAMTYDGRRIWGVTAGIVRTFYDRLTAS